MARYNTPIWQDKSVLTNAHVYILKDGQWVDTGRHFTALPGQTMPSYLINRIAEDYVKSKAPTFNIMSLYSAYTETQPDAYQVFKTDYNNTEYGMYNDWSYEIRTDTGHCQNAPVNRHADARQILTYGRWGVSGESITVKDMIKPVIFATPTQLNFGAEQTYGQTIVIEANKTGEILLPSWLHASDTAITAGTNVVYVYPDENTGWEDREANIIVKCDGYEEDYDYIPVVYVSQAGIIPYFYVSPVEKSVEWESGTTAFLVSTNMPYSAATSQSWITYSGSTPASSHNYNAIFVYSANTGDNRDAVITFTYQATSSSTATTSVVLRQAHSPLISVEPPQLQVNAASQSINVTISSEAPWQVVSGATWLSCTPSAGTSGDTEVSINIELNSGGTQRNDYIYFTNGIRQIGLNVIQNYMIDVVYYRTTNHQILTIDETLVWGNVAPYSHRFENNQGVISFFDYPTEVPYGMFSGQTTLFSVSLPESINKINSYSFTGCTNFNTLSESGNTLVYIDKDTGLDKRGRIMDVDLGTVSSPNGYIVRIKNNLAQLQASARGVAARAYYNGRSPSGSTFNISGLIYIGEEAFAYSDSFFLSDLYRLKKIYDRAFYYSKVGTIYLYDNLEYIGNEAFYNSNISTIRYWGTMAQWADVYKGNDWCYGIQATYVQCNDGNVPL